MSQAAPPTKRKGGAGHEQQLANARNRKQQIMTQKQLAAELLEIEEIKNPIPPHMQLLELCRLAAADGSSFTTTEMREIGGFRYDIVKEARKLYADDMCKKPGFSQEELDLHESEVFKRFYGFAHKPGRKALDPIFMVALTIFIKEKLYVDRNFDCVTDMENFWKHVVLECAKLRHVDVPELARSVKFNVFKSICPKIWRGKGKFSIKNRKAALLDPCGAISMAAAWPIFIEGINRKCLVCFDKMSHLIGHDPPTRCRLPKDIMEMLRDERRTPTFSKGMGQERSFGITLGLEISSGLQSCTFHISDETITEISHLRIAQKFYLMFEPYTAKSEENAREAQIGVGIGGGEAGDREALSLAMRTALHWVTQVQIPSMKLWREQLMQEARDCGFDPSIYESMGISVDGEHSHLHSLLDIHAAILVLEHIFGFKLPAGHSGNVAVPDVAPIFPILHAKLIKLMKESSAADIEAIISENQGLARAVTILMGLNGMSRESKETFKRALALGYSIVNATVNVSTVTKGFKDACIFPFDREKMITKMYPSWSQLSGEVKSFVLATIDGPLKEGVRQNGWNKSSYIETCIKQRDTPIVFPPRSKDFDQFQWNRQGAIIFFHEAVLEEHQRRRTVQQVEAVAQAQRSLSKDEEQARLLFRKSACSVGSEAQTGKTKCGCGRSFDGTGGFKAHEKSDHHKTFYATRNWELEFTNAQVPRDAGAAAGP
jgi:hypothetical protein